MHKRQKYNGNQKDTRWDRIRKRYSNFSKVQNVPKSDVIKRFIEMDFVGKHHERMFNEAEGEPSRYLNPVMVMDMRHKFFKTIPKALPLTTKKQSQHQLEHCIAHNAFVEEHFMQHELKKFRNQLEKNYNMHKLITKHNKSTLKLDHAQLQHSLLKSTMIIEDFHSEPIAAEVKEMTKLQLLMNNERNDTLQIEEIKLLSENHEQDPKRSLRNEMNNERNDTFQIEEITVLSENHEQDPKRSLRNEMNNERNDTFHIEEIKLLSENPKRDPKRSLRNEMNNERNDTFQIEEIKVLFENREQDPKRSLRNEMNNSISNLSKNSYSSESSTVDAERNEKLRTNFILDENINTNVNGTNTFSKSAAEFKTFTYRNQLDSTTEHQRSLHLTACCSNVNDKIGSVTSDTADKTLFELQLAKNDEKPENGLVKLYPNESEIEEQIEGPRQLLTIKRLNLVVNPNGKKLNILDSLSSKEPSDDESSTTCSEQNHIVNQLFRIRTHENTTYLRKYFLMWIHYTTMEKIERDNYKSRRGQVERINAFLDKVRREKVRQIKCKTLDEENLVNGEREHKMERNVIKTTVDSVILSKKYKNKIKTQQDIIDFQRLKLERQERFIMQLKLHKLSQEVIEARGAIKNDLKEVIKNGNQKMKGKAKCLQLIGNIRNDPDQEFNRLTGTALLEPKFLQNMQARALERSIKHEQAKQRRLQQEAEREAQKIAADEAKRLEDEEVKRMRIEILKEKRRQEKMAKILKERNRQRAIENEQKAQQFCRIMLLRNVGMEGFKRLVKRKHQNQEKSEVFRNLRYKRIYFEAWHCFVEDEYERKRHLATECYNRTLKRNALQVWKEFIIHQTRQLNISKDWYELKLTEQVFKVWQKYSNEMHLVNDIKIQQASAHHEWHLKWKVLTCWQRLPQILQIEKEIDERRQKWRLKIWELLPDYSPNRDDFD